MNGWIDLLGYTASFIVLVSLLMKSLVRLRWINAFGSLLFVIFAVSSGSIPTAVMNIGIVFIDLYYLYRLSNTKDSFEILPVTRDNEVVRYFYGKNRQEIESMFGGRAIEEASGIALFFRNNDIAGLLAYGRENTDTARIYIDFVVPRYRDSAVGKHFFVNDLSFWKNAGFSALECVEPAKTHQTYLERIGFVQQNNPMVWRKEL